MTLRTQATASVSKMMQTIKDDKDALEQEVLEREKTKRKIEALKQSINSVVNISPEEIRFKNNVRHKVDENSSEFVKLCESIKKFGLMENVVAELKISRDEDSYELICVAGHRRLTALKKLGFKNRIPCLIKFYKEGDKGDRVGAALSENLNREGLNCVDIADGYSELIKSGWTIQDLIKHFEKTRNTVQQYLRISNLPDDVKDAIRNNPEKLSTRVIFRDLLTKTKNNSEIRKLVNRRIDAKEIKKAKIKPPSIKDKLNVFLVQKDFTNATKEAIIEAFHFVGVLK